VDIEKEILDTWVRRKKEAYWEIGRLLCEARPMYAYKKGYIKWVKKKFGHEFSYRSAHNYKRLYECCKPKEHIQYFSLKFLRKICEATFREELRQWLFDNREMFNNGLSDEEFDQLVENVTSEGFDPEDPQLQEFLKALEEGLDELDNLDRTENELRRKLVKYNEWMVAAKSRLWTDDDGKVRIRRKVFEEELSVVVEELERLERMPPYELVD
jgi:hypothetical protein